MKLYIENIQTIVLHYKLLYFYYCTLQLLLINLFSFHICSISSLMRRVCSIIELQTRPNYV